MTELPHDDNAEQCVIGASMLSATALTDVAATLDPAAFFRPNHATIFGRILAMRRDGEPVDPVTVADELRRHDELVRIGGASYLHTLIAAVPTAANAMHYAEIVAERAARRRLLQVGQRITQLAADPGTDTEDALSAAEQAVAEARATGTAREDRLLAGIRSGSWLDTQEFAPLRYAVPGIIPEGTTVLAGAPKVGKSWAVLHIGLSVAAGTRVFGCLRVGSPRPVLYLALEDGWRRLQSRARALLDPGKPIPDLLRIAINVRAEQVVGTIAAWLDQHADRSPLVIVDTLGRVMPPAVTGESAYGRDYRAVVAFKRLADEHPGSSMVLVHHTRKLSSPDFVDGVSGTLGITGAADTTVVLSRDRSDDGGLLKVTGRDVIEAEYAVDKADAGTWTLTGGSLDAARDAASAGRASAGLGDRSTEIVEMARVAGADGIRAADVVSKLGIAGKDASQYLSRLARADRLGRAGRGLYILPDTTHTTHTTPTLDDGNEYDEDTPEDTVVSVVSVVLDDVCSRCRRPADERLINGRCRSCAYPPGSGRDDEQDGAA